MPFRAELAAQLAVQEQLSGGQGSEVEALSAGVVPPNPQTPNPPNP